MTKTKIDKIIKTVIILSLVVLLLSAGATYYFYTKSQKADMDKSQRPSVAGIDSSLLSEIAKRAVLPNEKPLIFTVSDLHDFKNQPFLSHAKPGDKLLIYQQERKAVLYDPVAQKILNIGPLVIVIPTPGADDYDVLGVSGGGERKTLEPLPQKDLPPLRIAVLNGTSTASKLDAVEALLEKQKEYMMVAKGNAQKRNYPKTLIIDLSGTRLEDVQNLAKLLRAAVSVLPENETRPSGSDALIIIGEM